MPNRQQKVYHFRDIKEKLYRINAATWVKKVKVTLVQALRFCTGCTAHRRSRGIALLFHDNGTSREWGVSVTPRPLFTLGKDRVPIVQEAGWAPGPVWTGAENLAPTGIRSPDRPTRSQSLYRLRYQANTTWVPWTYSNYRADPITVHKSIYYKSHVIEFTTFLLHTGDEWKVNPQATNVIYIWSTHS